jgi:hypothetical protein
MIINRSGWKIALDVSKSTSSTRDRPDKENSRRSNQIPVSRDRLDNDTIRRLTQKERMASHLLKIESIGLDT